MRYLRFVSGPVTLAPSPSPRQKLPTHEWWWACEACSSPFITGQFMPRAKARGVMENLKRAVYKTKKTWNTYTLQYLSAYTLHWCITQWKITHGARWLTASKRHWWHKCPYDAPRGLKNGCLYWYLSHLCHTLRYAYASCLLLLRIHTWRLKGTTLFKSFEN